MGSQAYCQVINAGQFIIVPNGVLLSTNQPYYVTVSNITNPNTDLSAQKFIVETYYTADVYNPLTISRSNFDSPIISLITVQNCQLQVNLSAYNSLMPADYSINLICPAQIKAASQLKLYLSWKPANSAGTCSGDPTILYST